MLLGFVALIAMINGIFDMIFRITFKELLGFILPRLLLSWAYLGKRQWMQKLHHGYEAGIERVRRDARPGQLHGYVRTHCGNRIGIPGILCQLLLDRHHCRRSQNLNEAGNVVARFGLKLLYGATLVSVLSATIAGLFL